jgi:uncharacterized protein (DUF2384 family)
MSSLHAPGVTSPEQLAEQLNHPTPEAVRNRALEVFGDEVKAKSWMNSAREIFDGHSPQQLIDSGEASQLRRILEALIRIDYGVFS